MPKTPCLAATYALDIAKPTMPRIDAMLITEPPPFRFIAWIPARWGVEDAVEVHDDHLMPAGVTIFGCRLLLPANSGVCTTMSLLLPETFSPITPVVSRHINQARLPIAYQVRAGRSAHIRRRRFQDRTGWQRTLGRLPDQSCRDSRSRAIDSSSSTRYPLNLS